MTKSAREVIGEVFSVATEPTCDDICPADFSDEVIRMLTETGYVILPKEPSEGMIEAGVHGWGRPTTFEKQARDIYRAMISHAEGEKDS